MKVVVTMVEYIGIIVFGIANIFAGVYLWGIHPALAIGIYAVSLICIVRGVSEILGVIGKLGK